VCAWAEQDILPAYAPLVAESNARRDAAQKTMDEWKARRDALAEQQKGLVKEIAEAASRLGAAKPDPELARINEQIKTAEAKVQALDAYLKALGPAPFSSLEQMAEFDRLTDQRAALNGEIAAARLQNAAAQRQIARQDPAGAKLADEWEALEVQRIAADNETMLAQSRRDAIARTENTLFRIMKQQADGARGPDALRLAVAAPKDATERAERFARRAAPEAVRALGERFFSQMTLTLPGLEETAALARAGRFGEALDAYKRCFFAGLRASAAAEGGGEADGDEDANLDGDASLAEVVFSPPSQEEIAEALAGTVAAAASVGGKARRVEASLGQPGAKAWVFVDAAAAGSPEGLAALDLCRKQGFPGRTAAALLHSYALGGPKEHLLRWSEVLDDWTMNWQRDVERSPLPIRDYNLLYVCRIQAVREKLRMIARMRPSFVDDLSAATLARWLMAMNEEYVSSAIRLGRSGLYNFRIMALNSMLPTSLKMQEFHVHQWAVQQGWRQVDDNFIFKIRRDGANFEFANDGHENTDQFMTIPFHALQAWNAQPPWTEPFWADEFLDNFAANARYRVHNLKPDGYCYRLSVRPQKIRYIGENPEYKVNLLAGEAEVRRRLWKVFGIGRPEEPPQVNSESLAFQGYYYLRSGWEPDDYFLYFQSIGQPILSGREENTGFSLYGHGGILLLSPAPVVDGRTQNIHHGLIMNPGGKAPYACYGKPDVVKTGRFHAGSRFDLAEGVFEGVYQYTHPRDSFDVFGSYGYESALAKAQGQAQRAGKVFVDEPITGVRQARQVISIRGRETYIVTDYITSEQAHRFTQDYTIYTPVRTDNLQRRLQLLRDGKMNPLVEDAKEHTLTTCNIGLPNLHIRHVGAQAIEYKVRRDARPDALLAGADLKDVTKKFSKRDRQHGDKTHLAEFSQQVAAHWTAQGEQVLITLITPSGPHYAAGTPPAGLRDVTPLAARPDAAGFTAKFADGGGIAYVASCKPAACKLGAVEATASALLVADGRGIALDCSRIASGGEAVSPPYPDFTFHIENERVVIGQPMYRPIQPVAIEPVANVFTDSAAITLSCAAPRVDIRYTLDGSRPTPQSPLYAAPITVKDTCRLKARAFRKGVTDDVWPQDGTHATVVYSAVFRKEPLGPARAAGGKPGLKYEYFEGVWTEIMARSSTMPALETGVAPKLFHLDARKTDGAFGLRYTGFIEAPADGVYTLYAPREFCFPDNDCGYDLRVFVDGREWNPAVRWHGHGTWSVALAKGRHELKVVFVDMRLRPHKVELMWGFPHPDFTWKGTVPDLTLSGPNLPRQSIPASMLSHD
jgi:hypothetical protein